MEIPASYVARGHGAASVPLDSLTIRQARRPYTPILGKWSVSGFLKKHCLDVHRFNFHLRDSSERFSFLHLVRLLRAAMFSVRFLYLLLFAVSTLRVVSSFFRYQRLIPNGQRVPNPCASGRNWRLRSKIWRGVGHWNPAGADFLNPFGRDFANSDHVSAFSSVFF